MSAVEAGPRRNAPYTVRYRLSIPVPVCYPRQPTCRVYRDLAKLCKRQLASASLQLLPVSWQHQQRLDKFEENQFTRSTLANRNDDSDGARAGRAAVSSQVSSSATTASSLSQQPYKYHSSHRYNIFKPSGTCSLAGGF